MKIIIDCSVLVSYIMIVFDDYVWESENKKICLWICSWKRFFNIQSSFVYSFVHVLIQWLTLNHHMWEWAESVWFQLISVWFQLIPVWFQISLLWNHTAVWFQISLLWNHTAVWFQISPLWNHTLNMESNWNHPESTEITLNQLKSTWNHPESTEIMLNQTEIKPNDSGF